MQILIYVLTMLMLLSILTYVRLDAYRNFAAIRAQFEYYMTKKERKYYTDRAIKWYESTPATKKEKTDSEKEAQIKASSRLSLYPLIDKKARESDAEEQARYSQVRGVLKKLIDSLYGKTKFYTDAANANVAFVDLIIDGISQAAEKLPKEQKISSANDLSNLDLGDRQLNEIFYKMLKGTNDIDSKFPAPKGGAFAASYPPLTKFINVSSQSKLRIYLAPRAVLLAMTGDEGLVNTIIQRRVQLYDEVSAEGAPDNAKEAASKRFHDEFQGSFPSVNDALLDFSVTKTNPKNYE